MVGEGEGQYEIASHKRIMAETSWKRRNIWVFNLEEQKQQRYSTRKVMPKLSNNNAEKQSDSNLWYLDNGAINHMSGKLCKFKELDQSIKGQVSENADCLLTKIDENSWLWHARLGHVSFKAMMLLSNEKMVQGMPEISSQNESKEEALEALKSFKTMAENGTVRKIKTLRTDRGGVTPYEAWSARKPNIGPIRVFRSLSHIKLPANEATKLSDRSKMVINLGKEPGLKLYRVYDPKNGSVHSSAYENSPYSGQSSRNEGDSGNTSNISHSVESTPPSGNTPQSAHSSFFNSNSESSSEAPRRYKQLSEIYDATEKIELEDDELMLTGKVEPTNFNNAACEPMRLPLALVAKNSWEVHHLEVKSAFLNGEIQEEVYVTQPEGVVKKEKKYFDYRLVKDLYGLRQVPRSGYAKLSKCLEQLGFIRCPYEHAVYTKKTGKAMLIIGVYVDDLLVTGTRVSIIEEFKNQLSKRFEMSNFGKLSYYLGIEVSGIIRFPNSSESGIGKWAIPDGVRHADLRV
ncbi:hypothetical protein AgCh_026310 [Apium graveolens]